MSITRRGIMGAIAAAPSIAKAVISEAAEPAQGVSGMLEQSPVATEQGPVNCGNAAWNLYRDVERVVDAESAHTFFNPDLLAYKYGHMKSWANHFCVLAETQDLAKRSERRREKFFALLSDPVTLAMKITKLNKRAFPNISDVTGNASDVEWF